jgi:hypothetical protein
MPANHLKSLVNLPLRWRQINTDMVKEGFKKPGLNHKNRQVWRKPREKEKAARKIGRPALMTQSD